MIMNICAYSDVLLRQDHWDLRSLANLVIRHMGIMSHFTGHLSVCDLTVCHATRGLPEFEINN